MRISRYINDIKRADTALLTISYRKKCVTILDLSNLSGFLKKCPTANGTCPPPPDILAEEKPGEGSGFKMDYTDIRSIYTGAKVTARRRVGCQVMGYVRARYKRAEPKYE